ncbi:MAG: hypothetical protein IPP63_19240 [Chloracidobacterium sp.]|nr:hypothetical protein [Chloracidobacterium sp.]
MDQLAWIPWLVFGCRADRGGDIYALWFVLLCSNEAAVKVYGSTWTAYPIEGETDLIQGEKVEVVEVRGSSIYVRRVTNELPEWRNEN